MTNGKDIHPDFTPELQKEGEDRGFSYEEVRKGVKVGVKINDIGFCAWLINIKKVNYEQALECKNLEESRQEYIVYLERENVTLQQQQIQLQMGLQQYEQQIIGERQLLLEQIPYGTKWGFNKEEIKSGVSIGVHPQNFDYAAYLKEKYQIPTETLKHGDINIKLGQEYIDCSKFKGKYTYPKFTLELQLELQKKGVEREFTREQMNEWIQVGIELREYNFVNYLRDVKKITPQGVLDNKDSDDYQYLRGRCDNFDGCRNCQQINTSESGCQPCAEKEGKRDLEQLTGLEMVKKFIQQQNSREDKELTWKIDRLGKIKNRLKGIPYEQFADIEYLAKGGFSKIYKAKGKGSGYKSNDKIVVLKVLNNSQNITLGFLTEITNARLVDGIRTVKYYGISQDPETENYIMIIQYIEEGNLRDYLKNNAQQLSWKEKFWKLCGITQALRSFHQQNLVHRDLHSGNILNGTGTSDGEIIFIVHGEDINKSGITDLGLSQPANLQPEEGKIFGVLPYIAPEVLQGKPYTKKSDIYSLSIIAYEIFSNLPPYYDVPHNEFLAIKICQGLRPQFRIKMPQSLENLISRCGDIDPQQRPGSYELWLILGDWYDEISNGKNTEFTRQLRESEEHNKNLPEEIRFPKYEKHPQVVYHSKPINTKQITEKLKTMEYSHSLIMDFGGLNLESSSEGNNIHLTFTPELIQSGQEKDFTAQQVKEGLDIGLQPTDFNFASGLRDTKHLTPEEVLNHGNYQQLSQEFFTYGQQTQIELPPK